MISLLAYLPGKFFIMLLQPVYFTKSFTCFFYDRSVPAKIYFLRQIPYGIFIWKGNIALVRCLNASQYFHQCCFAGTIFSYKTNSVMRLDHKRDFIEQIVAGMMNR